MTELLCERTHAVRGVGMSFLGQLQVGNRISGQAVSPALEQDELGLASLQILFDLAPSSPENVIIGAWRQRQVELCALGGA
jgi:hypothetical protein